MKQHKEIIMPGGRDKERSPRALITVPIVELAGDRRVLIENHSGVREYGVERICVLVKFGTVVVTGTGLKLSFMSRHQLVITGCIAAISIERKGG